MVCTDSLLGVLHSRACTCNYCRPSAPTFDVPPTHPQKKTTPSAILSQQAHSPIMGAVATACATCAVRMDTSQGFMMTVIGLAVRHIYSELKACRGGAPATLPVVETRGATSGYL
jgi:hypothetical protein